MLLTYSICEYLPTDFNFLNDTVLQIIRGISSDSCVKVSYELDIIMPQEFQVLQCYNCKTFQVHQVKKAKKWACKMCGDKQSIIKVYGRGTGAECRQHVQKLNTHRGEMDRLKETWQCHDDTRFSKNNDSVSQEENDRMSSANEVSGSRWTQFVEEDQTESTDDYEGSQTDDRFTTDALVLDQKRNSRKRKVNNQAAITSMAHSREIKDLTEQNSYLEDDSCGEGGPRHGQGYSGTYKQYTDIDNDEVSYKRQRIGKVSEQRVQEKSKWNSFQEQAIWNLDDYLDVKDESIEKDKVVNAVEQQRVQEKSKWNSFQEQAIWDLDDYLDVKDESIEKDKVVNAVEQQRVQKKSNWNSFQEQAIWDLDDYLDVKDESTKTDKVVNAVYQDSKWSDYQVEANRKTANEGNFILNNKPNNSSSISSKWNKYSAASETSNGPDSSQEDASTSLPMDEHAAELDGRIYIELDPKQLTCNVNVSKKGEGLTGKTRTSQMDKTIKTSSKWGQFLDGKIGASSPDPDNVPKDVTTPGQSDSTFQGNGIGLDMQKYRYSKSKVHKDVLDYVTIPGQIEKVHTTFQGNGTDMDMQTYSKSSIYVSSRTILGSINQNTKAEDGIIEGNFDDKTDNKLVKSCIKTMNKSSTNEVVNRNDKDIVTSMRKQRNTAIFSLGELTDDDFEL